MAYNFTAQWLKGAKNEAADALSRYPHSPLVTGDDLAEYEVDIGDDLEKTSCQAALSIAQLRDYTSSPSEQENLHLQELREHAAKDQLYQDLKKVITSGFPNQRGSLPEPLRAFWGAKDNLTIDDDLIVYGCCLLIPVGLRPSMLSRLHEAHQGVSRSKARARLTIYWPGIDHDIENFVAGCRHCQDRLPSNQKETIISKPTPPRPFQHIAVDFASYGGKQFLIVVDCKTGWPDVIEMGHDTTAKKLTDALRDQFCRTAAPDVLWSDGGPQFTAKHMAEFLQAWGVLHKTASPLYPQSNGKAESAVKSMKNLISAAWTGRTVNWNQLSRSLLQYRNTPCRKDGLSPAQKLFGHPIQDTLPAHRRSFKPEWQKPITDMEAASSNQDKAELAYNQQARDLPDLKIGSRIALQNPMSKLWDIYGVVTAIGPYRRYFVKTQNGSVLVRKRRFLRKRSPPSVAGPMPPEPLPPPHASPPPTPQDNPEPPGPTTPATTMPSGPRKSTRSTRRPEYLVEDPAWILSSSVWLTQDLGGEV